MGMNIKDPEVHAMARELAARRSTTVTDAVRQALRAELDRCPGAESAEVIEARKAAVRAICARVSGSPGWHGRSSQALQDALYDERGLPT